jgi:hypothetical protein
MDDFLSQAGAAAGPSATLLRQIRGIPGVRENGRHRFTVAPGVSLALVAQDNSWQARLDSHGRVQPFPLANAVDERKLIDALKRAAQNRDDD